MFPEARGRRNFGYTFFENELTKRSMENAKQYDLVLAGSTWCRDRMQDMGIANCEVLIQGIDPDIFHPLPEKEDQKRFIIFSGGKFELRKGQDLVLKAVKILQDRYPDVWLVNCWYNLWPASTKLMAYSNHIQFQYREGESWIETMQRTYMENDLDAGRILTHQLLPQIEQRKVFAQTDIGIFPNRCEGGTNLVLMEYMACAKPTIVSNTSGHKDIATEDNALLLKKLGPYHVKDAHGKLIARWEEPAVDEIVACLDYAYHNRSAIQSIGRRAGDDLKAFTWAHSAETLVGYIDRT
jgi:glycosyltransferase involved in cell wall biosynthesis